MRKLRFVGVRIIVFGIVFLGFAGLLVTVLWNTLIPAIFSLPTINFWQALGLLVLSRVLFGRMGGWGNRIRKARFVRGWQNLTDEERQRFRQAMGQHRPQNCGE